MYYRPPKPLKKEAEGITPIVNILKPGTKLVYDNDHRVEYEILSLEDRLFKVKVTFSPPLKINLGFMKKQVISEGILYIDREGFEYNQDKTPKGIHTDLWLNPSKAKIGDIVSLAFYSYHVDSIKELQGRECFCLIFDDGTRYKEAYYDKKTGLLLKRIEHLSPKMLKLEPNYQPKVSEEKLVYTNLEII